MRRAPEPGAYRVTMRARLLPLVREFASRAAVAIGFLGLCVLVYEVLHRAGVWYPFDIQDYGRTALICAVSIVVWRRFPLAHLVVVCILVAYPLWMFPIGQIRAIPLVLVAFLAANAGLSAAIVLPLAGAAALLSQFPGWIRVPPGLWPEWAQEFGLSTSLLIVGVVAAATLLGRASQLQRRSTETLQARNDELARLRESDRERIANEERAAIAREVHDVVAHHLAAIVVRAQAAARVADRTPDEPRAAVEWIADAGPQALAEMRSLVRVLRGDAGGGAAAAPASLTAAIGAVVDRVREAGIEVRAALQPPSGLTAVQEFAVLRVCQEALTNVLVHSRATQVDVTLAAAGRDAVLVVEDDGGRGAGQGSVARLITSSGGGSGIPGMRERAEAAGGIVTAGRTATGWRVELVVPCGEPGQLPSGVPRDAAAAP